jgi:VWFA-related protein
MVRQICFLIVAALLALNISLAAAADVASFRAGQAVVRHPDISVYVDVLDQAGQPVAELQQNQLAATLGQAQLVVKSVKPFDASGEGIAYVFLVDISKSLSSSQFQQIQSAINQWIDNMRDTDRAAIISFGEKVTTVQDYTSDKNALKNGVKTLAASDNKTQLHQGITKAIELSRRVDAGLPGRRIIITLSDGEDDFPGGMTRDEVLAAMKEDRIPIYAIGVSAKGAKAEDNRKKLGEFARLSGGELLDGNSADWAKLYDAIQQKILKSFLVQLDAAKTPADGKTARLQLTLTSNNKAMSDGLDLRILAKPVDPATAASLPWYKKIPVWGYAVAGGLLLLIIILIIVLKKKKAARLAAEAAQCKQRQAEEVARNKKAAEEAAAKAAAEKKRLDEQNTVKMPAPPGLKMKLAVLGSGGETREYGISLSSRAFVGRSSDCDLAIADDTEISKKHCELVLEGGYVLINDLNSTNGTFVNGVPVKTGRRLKSGDLVLLGRTEMRILF